MASVVIQTAMDAPLLLSGSIHTFEMGLTIPKRDEFEGMLNSNYIKRKLSAFQVAGVK
jgi:hypothetical protein